MSSGPEHYKQAEKFLADSLAIERGLDGISIHMQKAYVDASTRALATAQVHATLALAAATIEVAGAQAGGSSGAMQAVHWVEAIS